MEREIIEKEVEKPLKAAGFTGVMVKRFARMAGEFDDVRAFFDADDGKLMKAYNDTSSGSSHGLGKEFWVQFKKARKICLSAPKDEEPDVDKRDDAKRGSYTVRCDRMLRLDNIKEVSEFMEMHDIDEMSIVEMIGIIELIERRRKPKDVAPSPDATAQAK